MTETLGFDKTLTFILLGVLGLYGVGAILSHSADYDGVKSDDEANLQATAGMLQDLALIGAGGIFLLAAIRAEGHTTGLRVALAVIGILLVFHNVFAFGVSFGVNGSN